MSAATIPDAAEFDRVEAAINQIIDELRTVEQEWGVNWADVCCSDLFWRVNRDGVGVWMAIVSEASPDEWEFGHTIAEKLEAVGIDARIYTEW